MQSKAKFLGHPIHPMLVAFPIGLLATSVIFDVVALSTGAARWFELSYWMISAGLIGGALAAIPGLIDLLAIPSGTRAKSIGVLHAAGNGIVMSLFLVSWLLRSQELMQARLVPIVLSGVGLCLALVTGWLGGELVDRLGVGVDDDAGLNASSSLSTHKRGHFGAT